jgi:hypothetical protein
MNGWEYKEISHGMDGIALNTNVLSKWGAQGWEITLIEWGRHHGEFMRALARRPLTPPVVSIVHSNEQSVD